MAEEARQLTLVQNEEPNGSVAPQPWVPSDRPRDRILRFCYRRLSTIDVWRLLHDAEFKKLPGELTEDEIALKDILTLIWHLEAQESRGRR